MEEPILNKQITSKTILDYIKIATNIFLIICFLIGTYYYIVHTTQVNEAMKTKKPISLLNLYENFTGEHCICYNSLKEIPIIP